MSNCVQCSALSKYKCPVCRQPYCTVACYKVHKSNPCQAPEPIRVEMQEKSTFEYEFPTEDTVPSEKLQLLEQSADVKMSLDNPHVREILLLLDKSPHPEELMNEYMQEPIFTEFVDACLKVVQLPKDT